MVIYTIEESEAVASDMDSSLEESLLELEKLQQIAVIPIRAKTENEINFIRFILIHRYY